MSLNPHKLLMIGEGIIGKSPPKKNTFLKVFSAK
jgi:hypothetical protein